MPRRPDNQADFSGFGARFRAANAPRPMPNLTGSLGAADGVVLPDVDLGGEYASWMKN